MKSLLLFAALALSSTGYSQNALVLHPKANKWEVVLSTEDQYSGTVDIIITRMTGGIELRRQVEFHQGFAVVDVSKFSNGMYLVLLQPRFVSKHSTTFKTISFEKK